MTNSPTPAAQDGELIPDERALFEAWASDPARADKIPLDRWRPGNDGYKDTRTYLIYYGWKAGRAALAARSQNQGEPVAFLHQNQAKSRRHLSHSPLPTDAPEEYRSWTSTPLYAAQPLPVSGAPKVQGRHSDLITILDLDKIGMGLGARLAQMHTETIKGRDYLLRDSVMTAVVAWREAWDKNAKAREPIERATPPDAPTPAPKG